ncbi:hypothetical protein DSO57_1021057 [Entomophthora muscae]|uniref:Uncharacterized protein n=1 Tax=Entomophthora muscae TaxID=34485 RepID=A0ACC2T3W3_9FUNG|nr:hypothetical protein DSO57_1021057 [Entomophthora muscae]
MLGIPYLWSVVTIWLSLFLPYILSQGPATLCFPGPCPTPTLKLEELSPVVESDGLLFDPPTVFSSIKRVPYTDIHIVSSLGFGLLAQLPGSLCLLW